MGTDFQTNAEDRNRVRQTDRRIELFARPVDHFSDTEIRGVRLCTASQMINQSSAQFDKGGVVTLRISIRLGNAGAKVAQYRRWDHRQELIIE